MTTIHLRPRGTPDAGTRWHDARPRKLQLERETAYAWEVRLGPQGNILVTFPKYAWELALPTEAR